VDFHFLLSWQDSPIIDFYPLDFEIDLNGKKYAWQGKVVITKRNFIYFDYRKYSDVAIWQRTKCREMFIYFIFFEQFTK